MHMLKDCKEYNEYNGANASTASSYTDQVLGKAMNMVNKITVYILERLDHVCSVCVCVCSVLVCSVYSFVYTPLIQKWA